MLRLALQSDAIQLAELRWLSREEHDQRAEPLEIFTPRFTAWLVTAFGSGMWLASGHRRRCGPPCRPMRRPTSCHLKRPAQPLRRMLPNYALHSDRAP